MTVNFLKAKLFSKYLNSFLPAFLLFLFSQNTISQDAKYKIIGALKGTEVASNNIISLRYHPQSKKHVYYIKQRGNDTLTLETFLVKAKEISLNHWKHYLRNQDVIRDGESVFFNNGKRQRSTNYDFNTPQQIKLFYASGKVKSCSDIKRDDNNKIVKHGIFKEYDISGNLILEGEYKNDKKNGDFKKYGNEGNILTQGVYRNDKLIEGQPVINTQIAYEKVDVYPCLTQEGLSKVASYLDSINEEELLLQVNVSSEGQAVGMKIDHNKPRNELHKVISLLQGSNYFKQATLEGIDVNCSGWLHILKTGANWQSKWSEKRIALEKTENLTGTNIASIPQFPGGGEAIKSYIRHNIKYPKESQKLKQQGKCHVSFDIDTNGHAVNIKIASSSGYPLLDTEAMRIIREMPKFIPAKDANGKPYLFKSYTLPINFHLR